MLRSLFVILLLMSAACPVLHAQTPVWAGTTVNYEYGLPLAIRHDSGIVNFYRTDGGGTAYNHTVMIGARLAAPSLSGSVVGLTLQATLGLSSGNFTSDPFYKDSVVYPVRQIFTVSSTSALFGAEGRLRFGVTRRFGIEAGAWMNLRLISSLSQQIHDDRAGARDTTIRSGSRIASALIHAGPSLAVNYLLRITPDLQLQPEFFAKADLGALRDGLGTGAVSAGAGITFVFGSETADSLSPPPDTLKPRDPLALLPRKPLLNASLDIYCDGPDGRRSDTARVGLNSVVKRRIVPFVPVIFFDSNSAEIPERYARLGESASAAFTDTDLAQREPEELYHLILNVLGARLRRFPSARVTLYGSAAKDESADLAMKRAGNVRDYLVRTFGIDAGRVGILARTAAPGETRPEFVRCVHVSVTVQGILAPVVAEWVEQSYRLPPIHLIRNITAEAGIRRAIVEIMHGGTRVASSVLEQGEWKSFNLNLSVGVDAPLTARLIVEDSTGSVTEARDQLPLSIPNSRVTGGANGTDIVAVFADEPRDIPDMPAANTAASQLLERYITNGTELTLIKSPDRSSTGARLAEALMNRIRSRRLTLRGIHIVPAPDQSTPFPEDALFAGGVRAEVKR